MLFSGSEDGLRGWRVVILKVENVFKSHCTNKNVRRSSGIIRGIDKRIGGEDLFTAVLCCRGVSMLASRGKICGAAEVIADYIGVVDRRKAGK